MDMQLKGKRAFVSGASSGIGEAIALELAAEGADVAVSGRDRARTEATATRVEALGVKTLVTLGDVEKDADAWRIADEVTAAWGGVDILVNNAGNMNRKDVPHWLDVTPDEYLFSASLNLAAAVRLCQKLCPGMVERGWGRVINVSSVNGSKGAFGQTNYSAAKAGVHGFTKALALEVAKKGVTVNTISPGYIGTKMVTAIPQDILDSKILPQIPVGRLGKPEEVAGLIIYLASEEAAFVTGANIAINGGQHMQ
jgi:acetoacetyl-CoA reductase